MLKARQERRTPLDNTPSRLPRVVLRGEIAMVALVAVVAGGLAAAIAATTLDGIPHVSDGIAYAFQARIFASGHLWLQPPQLPDAFRQQHVILNATRWCSKYPPGWPLLLAPGWLAGVPWLVNPLLLALAAVGVWRLGRALFDSRTGLLAAAALAVSPFALLMGAGFMAHVPAMCASVWCMVALAATAERPCLRRAAVAGLLGGLAFLIRPYTALMLLWPAAAWCLWRLRGKGQWRSNLAGLAIGSLPCLLLFLAYNWLVFGGPFVTGYSVYGPESNVGQMAGPSASQAAMPPARLWWYIAALSRSLWGWPWPDLLVLLALAWPRPGRDRDAMLLACAASLIVGHAFYAYFDIIYGGPRLVLEAIGPLAVVTARALLAIAAGLARGIGTISQLSPRAKRAATRAIFAALGIGLLAFPLAVHLPREITRHSQWYHGQSAIPMAEGRKAGLGEDALVFVSGQPWVFGSFFLRNDLEPLAGRRVFVRDVPGTQGQVASEIQRREIWRVLVDLEPLAGPNSYADTFRPRRVAWERLR